AHRRVERPQTFDGILPHRLAALVAEPKDRIEQGASLEAERSTAGAQRSQVAEAACLFPLATERFQPVARCGIVRFVGAFLGGMGEECLPLKIVGLSIVPAEKGDRECANDARGVGGGWCRTVHIDETLLLLTPGSGLVKEFPTHVLRQIDQDDFNLDHNEIASIVEISTIVKVVFVDDRTTE